MTKKIKIDQVSLVASICQAVCDQQEHNVPAHSKIMNAFIKAADLIVEEIDGYEYEPVKKHDEGA
ncbi:hypothetical protein J7384_17230 [Endozoicomonas sp. G2_1]|uniref:hypothetical protein n=1 Tax=Endozoicomonas sp. G2_1 TaxID=2821091 RepID=UPI001ADC0DF8|nr:hypothetical protein [Endozoicomonas sp. G2_1]MBO9492108.1 hypothetical protein [Endozoicomonas sp. G2_1]